MQRREAVVLLGTANFMAIEYRIDTPIYISVLKQYPGDAAHQGWNPAHTDHLAKGDINALMLRRLNFRIAKEH